MVFVWLHLEKKEWKQFHSESLSWHDFRESYSLCTMHEGTGDISQHPACPKMNHVTMLNKMSGSLASFSMIRLASKFFAKVTVTFVGFASVMSTRCCSWHVKEDDRVFPIFVLPPNHFDKVAVTFFDNVIVLTPCCNGQSCLQIS